MLFQRGKGCRDRLVELVEIILAGKCLAELLKTGKFFLGRGRGRSFLQRRLEFFP
ncbi:MAG: hypothetical protein ABSG53_13960 [Thermoguttaceae bacterium]